MDIRGNTWELVGLDNGYGFEKTSTGMIFPSMITEVEPILGYGRTLKWNNTLYYVGIGNSTVSLNKIDETITSVLSLYALCGSIQGTVCRVVTGLPIGQYKDQKDALRALFKEKLHESKVEYDGVERTVIIDDAAVFPQGLLPYDKDYISVDIGSVTVDIAFVENGDIVYSKTLFKGMRKLHSKVIDEVNRRFDCTYPNDRAHRILTEGLYVLDKPQDISFLYPIYREYVEDIVSEVREFTQKIVKVYVTGGGASILFDSIKRRIPDAELVEDAQFSNAEMFRLWGEALWQK